MISQQIQWGKPKCVRLTYQVRWYSIGEIKILWCTNLKTQLSWSGFLSLHREYVWLPVPHRKYSHWSLKHFLRIGKLNHPLIAVHPPYLIPKTSGTSQKFFPHLQPGCKTERFIYVLKTVEFHCRRTLSAGMAWASSFASLTVGSQDSCYSRGSRRLPFHSTR